jgi:hypothetical protein
MADYKRITWATFADSGMFWLVNRTLHLFGLSLVRTCNEAGEIVDVYPVRTECRGFPRDADEVGFNRLTQYIVDNGHELLAEVSDEPESKMIAKDTQPVPSAVVVAEKSE